MTKESTLPARSADAAAKPSNAKKPFDPEKDIVPHILAKLDPEWLPIFTEHMTKRPPPEREQLAMEYIRAHPEEFAPLIALDTKGYPRTAENEVVSEDGAKVPVRVYYPDEQIAGPGPYAVHLNFHGGGFVLGDLTNESTLCMSMCEAGIAVVDVNYRHCPEALYGKCYQDAFAALKWVRDQGSSLNFDASSISFGGISAGGAITLVLHHLARDAGIPIKLILPSVPSVEPGVIYKFYTDSPWGSIKDFCYGPVLPWASIKWFGGLTNPPEKREELHRLWPAWWFNLFLAPNFEGLAPVFMRTAEVDPLRDEGEVYAAKLVEHGISVTVKRYRGSVHTFMAYPEFHRKKEYDADAIAALKAAHGLK